MAALIILSRPLAGSPPKGEVPVPRRCATRPGRNTALSSPLSLSTWWQEKEGVSA